MFASEMKDQGSIGTECRQERTGPTTREGRWLRTERHPFQLRALGAAVPRRERAAPARRGVRRGGLLAVPGGSGEVVPIGPCHAALERHVVVGAPQVLALAGFVAVALREAVEIEVVCVEIMSGEEGVSAFHTNN